MEKEKLSVIEDWMRLAKQKLAVAQEMIKLSYFDDAISRAYYAMLYAAKALLLSIDVDAKSHSGVLNQFGKHFIKTGKLDKQYSRMFALALRAREVSDYAGGIDASYSEAEAVFIDAKAFVARIREFLDNTLV